LRAKAVDLELAQVGDGAVRVALDLRRPFGELVGAEDVVEAQHALGVLDRREEGRLGAAADRLGGGILALELGEGVLDELEAADERVVRGVVLQQLVAGVVRVAQLEDAHRERLDLGARGIAGELVDGDARRGWSRGARQGARQSRRQSRSEH